MRRKHVFTRIQLSLRVLLLLSLCAVSVAAQDRVGTVQVRVRTDHADWRYTPGQPVKFTIAVIQDGQPVTNAKLTYRIGPEQMPPRIEQTVTFTGTEITVDGGTLNEGGFLRCIATAEVNGKIYRGLSTAGFAPETIKPTMEDPADFDGFWNANKERLAKIPLDAKVTPLPESSTANVICSHVNLQNIGMGGAPSRLQKCWRAPGSRMNDHLTRYSRLRPAIRPRRSTKRSGPSAPTAISCTS